MALSYNICRKKQQHVDLFSRFVQQTTTCFVAHANRYFHKSTYIGVNTQAVGVYPN